MLSPRVGISLEDEEDLGRGKSKDIVVGQLGDILYASVSGLGIGLE